MKLQSPTGIDIVGTQETIPGVANIINDDIVLEDSEHTNHKFKVEYGDQTEVDWDRQETNKVLGQRVFVDANGGLWLERELKLV